MLLSITSREMNDFLKCRLINMQNTKMAFRLLWEISKMDAESIFLTLYPWKHSPSVILSFQTSIKKILQNRVASQLMWKALFYQSFMTSGEQMIILKALADFPKFNLIVFLFLSCHPQPSIFSDMSGKIRIHPAMTKLF